MRPELEEEVDVEHGTVLQDSPQARAARCTRASFRRLEDPFSPAWSAGNFVCTVRVSASLGVNVGVVRGNEALYEQALSLRELDGIRTLTRNANVQVVVVANMHKRFP